MNNLEVVTKVNEVLSKGFELPLEKLKPDAKLADDLGLDSLDGVDMLVHLEDNLGIKIDGERLMHVKTLQDVYLMVEELQLGPSMPAASAAAQLS
jgi:acyl carrier protein